MMLGYSWPLLPTSINFVASAGSLRAVERPPALHVRQHPTRGQTYLSKGRLRGTAKNNGEPVDSDSIVEGNESLRRLDAC